MIFTVQVRLEDGRVGVLPATFVVLEDDPAAAAAEDLAELTAAAVCREYR